MKEWPAVCGPQDKAQQQSETCGFQTIIGAHSLGKRYQLQSHEANDIYLNAGFTQSWIPPVNTVLHGGQIGSLWGLERHGTIHCVASLQHRIICLQVLAQGQVRNMTPQQVVRQIPPLTALPQGVPGTVSSAILFSFYKRVPKCAHLSSFYKRVPKCAHLKFVKEFRYLKKKEKINTIL